MNDQILVLIAMCSCWLALGLLAGALTALVMDRRSRLHQMMEIAKVKQDFSDMLAKALEANNSHAKEIMRLSDQLLAHDMMLRGSSKR